MVGVFVFLMCVALLALPGYRLGGKRESDERRIDFLGNIIRAAAIFDDLKQSVAGRLDRR